VNDALTPLREEFPGFRIWMEVIGERTRYIARSAHPGQSPHTVVASSPGELGAALRENAGKHHITTDVAGTTPPSIAGIYNYWLGGQEHHTADREAAQSILADFPEIAHVAQANREFVTRAVQHVAKQGVTQFIDVGSGLPATPAVHEMAQRIAPAARVGYVDNDALVLAHARALLADTEGVTVIEGDLRDPGTILSSAALARLIDLDQPVCIILAAVLHFLSPAEADTAVAAFTGAMAPGSYLILSSGTSTGTSPALIDRLRSAYAGTALISGRTAEEITGWFSGLALVRPGLVDVQAWRPGRPWHWLAPPTARIIGAVGRKPGPLPDSAGI